MGAQSLWTSMTMAPFDVSRFMWNTSGAFSGIAGGCFFAASSEDAHPVNPSKAAPAASADMHAIFGTVLRGPFRIAHIVCHAEGNRHHMALYDDFAWFYNRYWNEEFHGLAFPILERIWLSRIPARGRILDICCGTGYLAGLLTERGFQVAGVDASAAMIAHANENVPQAEFHVGEAAEF